MQLQLFWQDLRYSLRGMHRNPGFAATVALTFGLGIGATTAIFTVVSGVLLRPLPFPQPDRLVSIKEDFGAGPNVFIASPSFVEFQKHSRTMSHVAAYFDCSVNLLEGQEAEHLDCGNITESLLPLLGVRPVIGRNFLPEEDRSGGPPAVILSHAFWKRRYAGDPSILGKLLVLDDKSYRVVGVLPEGFQIPGQFRVKHELWLPFQLQEDPANLKILWAIGRMRPEATLAMARAELNAIFQAARRGRKTTGSIVLTEWQQQITGGVKSTLVIFLAAIGFVLLIACVNVANLLLSRATGREKEMAVRRALGASTTRILSQLLTESVLMAFCGGLVGLLLAFWAKDMLVAFLSKNLPTVPPIPLDLRVLAFNLGLALVCGIAFGIAPALHATRIPVHECLKESGRGAGEGASRSRLRDLLVVSEVALAMALLIGAGLLFRSFLRLRGMDSGTPADCILTMNLRLRGARYSSPQSQSAFFHAALEKIRGVPGVQFAAATSLGSMDTEVEGRKDVEVAAEWNVVSPDYFHAMGLPLLRGRDFADSDARGAPEVALVSQSFARRYFPNEDCVGRRLGSLFQKDGWMTIIGTVGDWRAELESDPQPTIYTFYLQQGKPGAGEFAMTLLVRAAANPTRLAGAVGSQLAALDRTQAPTNIETLEQQMAAAIAPRRVNMLLLVSFALLALLLGSAGIYGVMSHAVSRRTHEIGVRMALGADHTDVATLIVGRGLLLVVAGEAVGLLAALALNRVIASMLFHVAPTDPFTYAAVAAVWAAVGLIACYIPARRALKVDPTVALRSE